MSQAHDMASDALDELEAAAEERRKILAAGGDAKETIEKAAAGTRLYKARWNMIINPHLYTRGCSTLF